MSLFSLKKNLQVYYIYFPEVIGNMGFSVLWSFLYYGILLGLGVTTFLGEFHQNSFIFYRNKIIFLLWCDNLFQSDIFLLFRSSRNSNLRSYRTIQILSQAPLNHNHHSWYYRIRSGIHTMFEGMLVVFSMQLNHQIKVGYHIFYILDLRVLTFYAEIMVGFQVITIVCYGLLN